ncbi:MAG: glycosyltransferase family 4 protein [Bacteroidales bacterium]|jgi:glycosyltransferase involved in cell wall biosynthesis
MKLLYLHQYFTFPDESGGTRSYDLATSFAKKGIEVTVITATSDEKYNKKNRWTLVERDSLKVFYIFLPYENNLSNIKRIIVFFKFLWYSTFKLLHLKGDFVLATSTPLTIGIPALMKKWLHKTPFIFEVRDVWPEAVIAIGAIKNKLIQKTLYSLEKKIYKNATAIVPLSTDMQKSIVTRYPKLSEKANVVIENISEISRFQNKEKKIDIELIVGFKPRFSILYAGTFGQVNGVHYVVELAKKTLHVDPGLVYILIGKGAKKQAVIDKAQELDVLNRNVFILEPISKNELPLWYNTASMGASFVIDIKELWANSANKFFDTLAAGKPILINHEGWQAEVIREKNIGYVLPQSLSKSKVESFVNYTKDRALIDSQERNALQTAIDCYSLDKAVEKYLKVFEMIK